MPISLSPAVSVAEKDLTSVIPAVSTSIGAGVLAAAWGPVSAITSVASENKLVQLFGKPNDSNAADWLNVANFMGYSSSCLVVRADTAGQRNSVAALTGGVTGATIVAGGSGYVQSTTSATVSVPQITGGDRATVSLTVTGGAITAVTITNAGTGYTSAPTITVTGAGSAANITTAITQGGIKINNFDYYNSTFANGEGVVGEWAARYPGSLGNSLRVSMADSASFTTWAYKGYFTAAPGTSDFVNRIGGVQDEMHVVVIDRDGRWTGTAGTVLEQYAFVSKASDAKKSDGTAAYYVTAINSGSQYIYWMDHTVLSGSNWGSVATNAMTYTSIGSTAITLDLVGGVDDFTTTDAIKQNAFALFNNSEQFDISLVLAGASSREVARYVIDNLVESRKDCMAFISPRNVTTGNPIFSTSVTYVNDLITFKNGDGGSLTSLTGSSYAVFDTGYKYQYDRYNDKYRWVPLNGDVAGLCARTDYTNDPWYSPAGYNRGQVKNAIKLAVNPPKADRDTLYMANLNPVVSFPGQGVILYGDKTAQAKSSAFDRINVRRLFITLEKAIATAAKYQLFEFNDGFTRAQFRNQVEPFLRDVQGRRGIVAFKVIVDETNNTSQVIDSNQFIADIYISPSRSINTIQLNFVATRTGASFTEIAGSAS